MGKESQVIEFDEDSLDEQRTGFGREIKIGVAVLVCLLVGLGIAVTVKLLNTSDAPKAATNNPSGAKPAAAQKNSAESQATAHSAANDAEKTGYRLQEKTSAGAVAPPSSLESDQSPTPSATPTNDRYAGRFSSTPPYAASPLYPDPAAAEDAAQAGGAPQPDPGPEAIASEADPIPPDPAPLAEANPFQQPVADPAAEQSSEPFPPQEAVAEEPLPPDAEKVRHQNLFAQEASAAAAESENAAESQAIADHTAAPVSSAGREHSPLRSADVPHVPDQQAKHDTSSAATEARPRAANKTYVVQPNDNLRAIAEKVYGSAAYERALEAYLRDQGQSASLRARELVSVPPPELLEQKYADRFSKRLSSVAAARTVAPSSPAAGTRHSSAGTSYRVLEGDTLFDIARRQLGKASRWAEIYELNRKVLGDDFDFLAPGTELAMPADARSGAMTLRPRAPYRR